MKPYYRDKDTTIYNADVFEVLPHLSGIDAVITDPPYASGGRSIGNKQQTTRAKYVQTKTKKRYIDFEGDHLDQRSWINWTTSWMTMARKACRPGAPIGAFIDWRQLPAITDAIQFAGWLWKGIAVWSKKYGRPAKGQFSSACEFFPFGFNGQTEKQESYTPGIVECATLTGKKRKHQTQKPLPVMCWALDIVKPASLILDPFIGSGTTLVAARALGHRSIGIDSSREFCDMAIERLKA